MLRSLAFVALLSLGVAMPAAAQQLTEREARQVAQGFVDSFDKLTRAKDAAGLAARYTEDAVRVMGSGDTVLGREAIKDRFAKGFESFDNDPLKLDQVKVLSNDVIVAIGSWSGTWHGPDGPVHQAGRWLSTEVRVGDTWKIAANLNNVMPPK